MKANAPEKIYVEIRHPFGNEFTEMLGFEHRGNCEHVEYTRTDAFIEKAAQFLYDYNQKQILKHGARATRGCGKYTINVYKFKKYMKGE